VAERHVSGGRLSAFLDDELDDEAAIVAARHIAGCDRCLLELEGLRATRDALRSLPTLQAPVLASGDALRPRRARRVLRRALVAAAAGALPLLAGVVVYVVGAEPGSVEPSTELFLVEHVGRTGGGPVPAPVAGER
jgi:anti-sigma factor RsiW